MTTTTAPRSRSIAVDQTDVNLLYQRLSRHKHGAAVRVPLEGQALGWSDSKSRRIAWNLKVQGRFHWIVETGVMFHRRRKFPAAPSQSTGGMVGPRPPERRPPTADAGKVRDRWEFTVWSDGSVTYERSMT